MNVDNMKGFSLPKAEGDCNVTWPGGGMISSRGSNLEYCQKSDCAARDISVEEEDLINRLHKLLGDRWALIAGRLPWRRVEEIENYCKMRYTAAASSSCS